jgi:hypothetical protein
LTHSKRVERTVFFNIPKVSDSLRERVSALAADPSKVVSRTYARLLELEESYVNLPLSVREDVLQFLQYCARLWFDTLVNGKPPSSEEMESLANAGRRRVHQGIALTPCCAPSGWAVSKPGARCSRSLKRRGVTRPVAV